MLSILQSLFKKTTTPAPEPVVVEQTEPVKVVHANPTPVVTPPQPSVNTPRTLVTLGQLRSIFPGTPAATLEKFVDPINVLCAEAGINTKFRLAHFLAQVGHESGGLKILKENLNYSADGLERTFKKYFPTRALAVQYARKPEAIGSRVYANRMGNGPEASKEGYRYRGRGAIQLTGKTNYTSFAKYTGKTLTETIAYLETPTGAIHGAVWFWWKNGLNALADSLGTNGVPAITRKVNGGTNGLADRQAIFNRAVAALI